MTERHQERELLELEIKLARLKVSAAHARARQKNCSRSHLLPELLGIGGSLYAARARSGKSASTPGLLLTLLWRLLRREISSRK
ncbi:hypothetical protein [Bergeriella denitrificans]|uniref:Uncharacterized protein n=1 Tax=Bergeriella denitrificans TaxID=494 RepID=A0A378UED3_BERDE|nr:hypothetical protein [Bergeriella denitrificans]STZ75754.1 Uncharacterised protein [Bergeriella denitrificans]